MIDHRFVPLNFKSTPGQSKENMKPSTFKETVAFAFNIHKVFKLKLYNMLYHRWHFRKLCHIMANQQVNDY